jgi:asparagine synthase (glutamine-hydrolysing)
MCGICGIFSPVIGNNLEAMVKAMNMALVHRGPDGSGCYIKETVGIAMRRLAIIDVARGNQPIFNESASLAIVFNGEIYNFPELRERLQKNGHQFQTHTDTEAILHLYEDHRESTPQWLKGMFAFCLYDHSEQSLFLARDRFGEKPLYYYSHTDVGFVFSSEIRSLLECPLVPRRLNREALGYYLRVGFVPTPLTMLTDVYSLPPGHWLKWQKGQMTIQPYYTVNYTPDPVLRQEPQAIAALQEVLLQAVKRQSISDVPLGAFLSGGVDSSSVVAILQSCSSRPIKTFTIRFEEAGYDESVMARTTAAYLGTEHQEFVVPNVAFTEEDLWRIVAHVGLPFTDSSAIPTYILSKYVREHVTVALSGDGGDEMFAGYPLFQWGQTLQRLGQRVPRSLLQAATASANWLSQQPGFASLAKLRRIRRGLAASLLPEYLLPVAISSLFEPTEIQGLLTDANVMAIATGDLRLLTELPPEAGEWSLLRRLMYYRLKHDLPGDMLIKVDRMSMACGLEVRTPMLDVDLAELSMRLPDELLLRNGIGKYLLRQTMRDKLPDVVFEHPKTGFSIPLYRYQNAHYQNMATTLLADRDLLTIFSAQALQDVLVSGLARDTDRADRSVYRASHQLWSLMQFAAWKQYFRIAL